MTELAIPVPRDADGTPLTTRASVRLITADGEPVLAWVGPGLRTEYRDLVLTDDTTLTLTPTAELALPDGTATWYEIAIATRGRTERYRVQVPDSVGVMALRDLVGADEIPPGSLPADIVADVLDAAASAEASATTATGAAAAALADADRAVESLLATSALLIETQESILGIVDAVDETTAQAGIATTQAGLAAGSAQEASAQAGTAQVQANNATLAAQTAASQAQTATIQAGMATGASQTATDQAGLAANSAQDASDQAAIASGQAGIATSQAGTATSQAQTATTQAGLATTHAGNSAASATLAQAWATQTSAEVVTGQGYGALKYAQEAAASAAVYPGVQEAFTSLGGDLVATQTLVLTSKQTLDTAAYTPVEDYATAAQGARADTALQTADAGSAAYTASSAYATASQGAKADSAVQPQAGQVRLGGVTDYLQIAADGTPTLAGAATYWDDLVGGIAAAVTSGPGVSLSNVEHALAFVATANGSDYAWLTFQLEHRWKAGSPIFPHLHFEQAEAAVPHWLIQYRWQRQGQAKTTWQNYKCNTPAFTWTSGTLNQICYGAGIAAPTGYSISDILQVRLVRDSTNSSGLFTGADPYTATALVTAFDIHIECDALGSRTEYVK